jgi:hypothetical protein
MQRAGIDASALVAIEPLATVTFPGGLWAQQTVQLRMRSVETPQFARLMANLDVVGASWAVGGVQLLHVGPGDRYDAGLTMTTLYPLDP